MPNELRYTLLPDGPSDEALLPILTWLLRKQDIQQPIQSECADLRRLPNPPKELSQRIEKALDLYPCELLFIHRDAEKEPFENRKREIENAINKVAKKGQIPPSVCVVPVRMQEAWLLFDENAIRKASGNRNGRNTLNLPRLAQLEQLPNPKDVLHNSIREASGLNAHRQKKLNLGVITRRVAEFVTDYSPLRNLSAFAQLEADINQVVKIQGWNT
jgi:hypothetical protein